MDDISLYIDYIIMFSFCTPVSSFSLPLHIEISEKNAPLGSFIKVTLFDLNTSKKFFANLDLTFHSWSPPQIPLCRIHYTLFIKFIYLS